MKHIVTKVGELFVVAVIGASCGWGHRKNVRTAGASQQWGLPPLAPVESLQIGAI